MGEKQLAAQVENLGETGYVLRLGLLAAEHAVRENKYSTVPFSGWIPGICIGAGAVFAKTEHHLNVSVSYGDLKSVSSVPEKLSELAVNADYCNLFKIWHTPDHRLNVKAGVGLDFLYNKRQYARFINSDYSFEMIGSLGAVVEIRYQTGVSEKGLIFKNRLTIPFLSYYQQPGYSGITLGSANTGSDNKDSHVGTFPDIARLINFFSVGKTLNRKININLYYNWAYYKVYSDRAVSQNSQQWGVLFEYYLNR